MEADDHSHLMEAARLDPHDYHRLVDAAKLRAHELRREASDRFWSDVGRLLRRAWRAAWAHAKTPAGSGRSMQA